MSEAFFGTDRSIEPARFNRKPTPEATAEAATLFDDPLAVLVYKVAIHFYDVPSPEELDRSDDYFDAVSGLSVESVRRAKAVAARIRALVATEAPCPTR